MRKLYLTMLLSLAAASAAQADDAKLYFGYCDDAVTGFQLPEGAMYGAEAIRIPAEQTQQWEGNKIWGMSVGYGTGSSKDVTLFLSYDLAGEPFYTEAGRVRRFKNWTEYQFDAPVEFEAGRDLYVGYYMACTSSSDYIMASDLNYRSNPDAALMATGSRPDELWGNFSDQGLHYGAFSVRLIVTGDNVPQNQAAVASCEPPIYVQPGVEFTLPVAVRNLGANKINDIDFEVSVGGQAPEARKVSVEYGIVPSATATVEITGLTASELMVPCPITVKITKVNGVDFAAEAATQTACTEQVVWRTMVVEEGTGTWCQYCPRGLYGLEYMRKNYGNDGTYLGISVHSDRANYDPYGCKDYYPWLSTDLISGLPGCSINRRAPGKVNPMWSILEQQYKLYKAPSPFLVSVEVKPQGKTATVTGSVFCAADVEGANYAWTFVLTEDGVGPQYQSNKYAYGDPKNEAPGYAEKGDPFQAYYDDLAWSAPDVMGIPGSFTERSLKAGQTYSYTTEFDLSKATNYDKSYITAMLLDLESGEILQAARLGVNGQKYSGVESVEQSAADASPVYFDLMGRRVANPQGGLFIKVQGGKSSKVIL